MRRRTIWLLLTVLVLVAVIGTIILLRARAAPEAARLLPESEAIIYINLKPIRTATDAANRPVPHEPEYQDFVEQTGFQFERDLDAAAIAVHAPEVVRNGKNIELQRRFSEIFVGHYDSARLRAYLRKLAESIEPYRNTDIYQIPYEGRTVRVALLSVDSVAISNTADVSNIQGMIDRYHAIASPFAGPSLLRDHYAHVPFGSLAWAIMRFHSPTGENTSLPLLGGINFSLPKDTVTIASVRYLLKIELKLEAFTTSEEEARRVADSANTFVQLFHSVEASAQPAGPDADVKAFFESLKVKQEKNRAVLTAELPQGFVKKVFSEAPAAATGATTEQKSAPEKTPATKAKKR